MKGLSTFVFTAAPVSSVVRTAADGGDSSPPRRPHDESVTATASNTAMTDACLIVARLITELQGCDTGRSATGNGGANRMVLFVKARRKSNPTISRGLQVSAANGPPAREHWQARYHQSSFGWQRISAPRGPRIFRQ